MNAARLTLLALRCPACGAGLEAESEDIVFYCAACQNGYRASDSQPALEPVAVAFLAAPRAEVAEYRPFWRLGAKAEILERQAAGAGGRGLGAVVREFLGGSAASGGAVSPLRFLIPAYRTAFENARDLALRYGGLGEELGQSPGGRLTGAALAVEDAHRFAEFLFLLREARAADVLAGLRYTLEFTEGPLLVGVPFTRRGQDGLVDARFGLPV